jgi:PAS domain S-box-containing protein
MTRDDSGPAGSLRARAEAIVRERTGGHERGSLELELDVCRVELEIQSDELHRRGQYADRLLNIAPVIILSLDASGRIEHYNRFMEELSGVALEEARGESWFETFVPAADHGAARAAFARSVRGREPVRAAGRIATRDGDERVIRWNGTALEDRDGEISAMLYVGVDVTEAVQHQREIRAERERNRAIFETALDAIIAIDESGVIEDFNPSAARMFGCAADEAIGRNIDALIPGGLREDLRTDRPEAIGEGRQLEGRREDGSPFPLHVSIAEAQVEDRRTYCAFIRDLTGSKESEARLRQAHKLEAIGTLASGVAHDFNNLLMGVSGCADVALGRLEPDSEARVFIEEIRLSARSGAAITKQLLAFTRKNELETTVFKLNEVIERSEGMLRRLLGEDIEIRLGLHATDSRIRADVGQIEQILMNLTVNARDAMAASATGGTLSIETDEATSGGENYVVLRIADTGAGMSEATLERVFDPFFSTKDADSGTGLGLSVVYGIITRAGGTIRVDSELGRGTTFEVLLPRASARITEDQIPALVALTSNPTRDTIVLVAEDDPTVRLAIRHYLETAGYRVLEATTGNEAIERIDGAPGAIDLLLTDMVLPNRGGASIARRLVEVTPDARVLYMSAHSLEWLVEQGRLQPGVKLLQKPFGQAELLAEIERALARPGRQRSGTVLLVDDDAAVRRSLGAGLDELGYEVLLAADAREALKLGLLHSRAIDALVVDVVLPGRMGVAVARELGGAIPGLVVVYLSGYSRSSALQRDLVDPRCPFVAKPATAAQLDQLIRRGAPSVLLVEDNNSARLALAEFLSDAGLAVTAARTGAEALDKLDAGPFDVLLVDYSLPDTRGDHLACQVREALPDVPVVYLSGRAGLELEPAGPCFVKPFDLELLTAAVLDLVTTR